MNSLHVPRSTVIAVLVLAGCGTVPVQETAEAGVQRTAEPVRHDADGAWIISEFHDSIVVHRRIGAYRRPAPIWSSLVLIVEGGSVRRYGTLSDRGHADPRGRGDTLLHMDEYAQIYVVHDPVTDIITLHWGPAHSAGYTQELHYRRLTTTGQPLLDALSSTDRASTFRDVYHGLLHRQLFVGRYHALDGNSTGFTIDTSGAVTGHPRWQDFEFHDYFGTLHPYADDLDALWFGAADGKRQPFNWQFRGDTLVLTELIGDGDRYGLGERQLRFLKH